MPVPKWFVVGRNQYRLTTSSIREMRPYFPYLVIALLALYVVYLAPAMVSFFIDEALAFFLSQAAVALIQVILFMVFVWFMFFPVSFAMKEVQASHLEIFLSAPIKPSHILLGEFLGVMPFYVIAVTVLAGMFTAILSPLGLGVIQMAIIILIFILTLFSALWIGTLIAVILRTRLGRSGRGQDIGKAIAVIIPLFGMGIMYAIMGGGLLRALADPGTSGMVRETIGLLPSSWGATVIIGFANNPGNIAAMGLETLTRFGGLIIFFVAALWLGTKLADRAYNLEAASFMASKVKPDGVFYKTVRSLGGGGSFGILLATIFKDYSRRLQNLSRIGYIVGLIVMINIFGFKPEEESLVGVLVIAQILFALLAAFIVGEVTVRGKGTLFIYRKAPIGEGRFLKARLVQGWVVAIPIAVAITVVQMVLLPQTTITTMLTFIGVVTLVVAAYVAFALGLFLLLPAFSEKGGEFMADIMIIVMVSAGVFIVPLELLGEVWGIISWILLSWSLGIVFLILGKRNLSRIE